jgi:hypothetical protein
MEPRHDFMKKMSTTARRSMVSVGFPVELRDKILDLTPYANDKVIHFLKENMGEHDFSRFIYLLTLPTYCIVSSHSKILLNEYPSWLTDIIEGSLNLLKSIQNLPNIFVPLKQILDEFVKTRGYYDPIPDQEFIDLSSRIVSAFITKSQLDPAGEDTTRIKFYFTNMVNILLKFMNDNSLSLDITQYNLAGRLMVQSKIIGIIHFLSDFRVLNKNEQNHKIIQRFNLKKILDYGKSERESDIRKLKKLDPLKYNSEWSIARGLDNLYEERQEERSRRRQAYSGQGGRRKKYIRSASRKKRNIKK